MGRVLDLQALIPTEFDGPQLNLRIRKAVSLSSEGAFLAAEIGQVRYGKNGRPLQPSSIISICTQPDDSLPELLRILARLFEQEEPIHIGEPDGD
jgi:hypothetical protein